MEKKIKIIVTDSNHIYREGLKIALSKIKRVEIVGEAASGCELLELLSNISPDLILLDTEMPGTNGINLCKTIAGNYPSTKVIAITIFDDLNYLASIINSGVNCFLQKNTSRKELERAINVVIDGQIFFPIHINQFNNNLNFTIMKTSKILLVDDDIDIINVLQAILSKNGYNVVTANNKAEGMRKFRDEKPDLAILDVMMTTHYEGFEMAKEIEDDPTVKKIPIIMLTSIDILITSKPDVQAMAREFRKNPGFKDLHVLLVKDIVSNNAGIDYLSEKGETVWFPVDGFIKKPVDAGKIIPEVKRLLSK
ncbi:MAG TPA: response regulator [Bacteroidales bacterium]|nr:response regulator [Bacteroidales bacterium]HPS18089.1 response regulator [Bacteroidales bacterium]